VLLFVIVVYSYERAVFVVYATLVYLPQLMGCQGGGGEGGLRFMYICDRLADLCIYSVSRRGGGGWGERYAGDLAGIAMTHFVLTRH
jgi:hypothetical protein